MARNLPRRIVLLVSSMRSGGAERVASILANGWAARGDDVRLIVTFSGRGECFYHLGPGVELVFLADHVGLSPRVPWARLSRLRALRRLTAEHRPDAVVSFLTNVNVAAIVACTGTGVPVVVSERSYPPLDVHQSRWLSALRRLTYPYADRVVMVTHKGGEWLRQTIPRARVAVIPNPVSSSLGRTKPVCSPEDYVGSSRKLVMTVGRLDAGKQIDILLRSFAQLASKHPDWDVAVLGDGPMRADLEALRDRLGLESRAHLLGQIGNVEDWYRRASIFVLPSRYEGFPNTLAEAMACGCAVVSYDCDTGPRDIVREGVDGILVRPVGDQQAMTAAIDLLMRDEALREGVRRRAPEVTERFSHETVLKMWDEVFDEARAP